MSEWAAIGDPMRSGELFFRGTRGYHYPDIATKRTLLRHVSLLATGSNTGGMCAQRPHRPFGGQPARVVRGCVVRTRRCIFAANAITMGADPCPASSTFWAVMAKAGGAPTLAGPRTWTDGLMSTMPVLVPDQPGADNGLSSTQNAMSPAGRR